MHLQDFFQTKCTVCWNGLIIIHEPILNGSYQLNNVGEISSQWGYAMLWTIFQQVKYNVSSMTLESR